MGKNTKFNMKKLVSILTICFFAIGLLIGNSEKANAETTTDFTGWTPISTAEDLEKLHSNSQFSKYYLTNDIDLKDFGYWNSVPVFRGILDGNGYCIKNLTSTTYGLVEAVAPGATIKNLRLVDVNIRTSNNVGGIATYMYCEDMVNESMIKANAYFTILEEWNELLLNVTMISNCSVSGSISSTGDTYVGGIVGSVDGKVYTCDGVNYYWSPKMSIDSCMNFATINAASSTDYVGGIVGRISHQFG